LRQSEARFRGTFENAAVGIAHEDLTGRFLRLNGRFCAILGYPPEELVGKTLSEVTHPEDLAADLANFGALTRGESSSYTMEKRFIRKDGTFVWAQLTVSLQFDAAEKPTYCIKIIQDITERKRAEEALRWSEKQYRELFENMIEGYAYCKMVFENGKPQDFIYLSVNRAFETLTGLTNVAGKSVTEVIPGIRGISRKANVLQPKGRQW
jgi:PAS domain S-box-containing protein